MSCIARENIDDNKRELSIDKVIKLHSNPNYQSNYSIYDEDVE